MTQCLVTSDTSWVSKWFVFDKKNVEQKERATVVQLVLLLHHSRRISALILQERDAVSRKSWCLTVISVPPCWKHPLVPPCECRWAFRGLLLRTICLDTDCCRDLWPSGHPTSFLPSAQRICEAQPEGPLMVATELLRTLLASLTGREGCNLIYHSWSQSRCRNKKWADFQFNITKCGKSEGISLVLMQHFKLK